MAAPLSRVLSPPPAPLHDGPRLRPEATDLRNILCPQRMAYLYSCPIFYSPVLRRSPLAHAVYSSPGQDSSLLAIAQDESMASELKQALEDSIYSTNRGLGANAETRSEIMEVITQLEACNPNPNPLESLDLMDGKWILRYTSLSELFPPLWAESLPLVKVGQISQTIDMNGSVMVNSVTFIGPVGTSTFSANASFEISSPKRLRIKFEEGVVGSPQLTDSLNLPESFSILGQKVDLTAFEGVFQTLQSTTYTIAKTISGQPPFKFPIRTDNTRPWLLTTYLDHDLRISRSENGTVFVFVKDGSLSTE